MSQRFRSQTPPIAGWIEKVILDKIDDLRTQRIGSTGAIIVGGGTGGGGGFWDSTINGNIYNTNTYLGAVSIGTQNPSQVIANSLAVGAHINLDDLDANTGATLIPGLSFGRASGEGINSTRILNPNNVTDHRGINFWTASSKRVRISHDGQLQLLTSNQGIMFADGTVQKSASAGWLIDIGTHVLYVDPSGQTQFQTVAIGTTNHAYECTNSLTVGYNILADYNGQNDGSSHVPGIAFGKTSGEGISSKRTSGGFNPSGLDFWTAGHRRLAILNDGTFRVITSDTITVFQVGSPSFITVATTIGNNTSPSYACDVSGQCHATSFPTSSDERFKTNVKPISNALKSVSQLRGVKFDWTEEYRKAQHEIEHEHLKQRQIGVIAQEVQKILPELVSERSDGYLSVDYGRMTAVLIEAVKELKAEVEDLKAKLNGASKSVD
jgi:hypothetical protein